MKKFSKIISVLCLMLVFCVCFVACDDKKDDKFYLNTNTKFNTFIDEICDNDRFEDGVIYGTNIQNILNNIKTQPEFDDPDLAIYTQLEDVYDKIFISSFNFLTDFKGVFINIPNDTSKNTKQKYVAFEQTIEDVTNTVTQLYTDVARMDLSIGSPTLEDALSPISRQVVKEFKRKYVETSVEVIDLCNQFLDICETYIYPKYQTYKTESGYVNLTQTQITNQVTLATLKSTINTLTPAITYLNAFDGEYTSFASDEFISTLDDYLDIDSAKQTVTVAQLENWLTTFNTFVSDTQNFYTALEKIDIPEMIRDFDSDPDLYLEEYPNLVAYINKVFTFTNSGVRTLYSSLASLCDK